MRASGGTITTFDARVRAQVLAALYSQNINTPGVVLTAFDASDVIHGFVRALTAPSQRSIFRARAQALSKARSPCNNPAGAIIGYYVDTGDVFHGFLRSP